MKKSMLIGAGFVAAVGLQFAGGVVGDYVSGSGDSETLVIEIPQDETPSYRQLADTLGLDYDREYDYRNWRLEALEKFRFDIPASGDCGTWAEPKECEQQASLGGLELLYCSHGRDITDNCDMRGEGPFIETVYLTEQNVTLLTQFRRDQDDVHTHVKLLKLAEGRRPELHES